MDNMLYIDMLSVDSTSGREMSLSDLLAERFSTGVNKVERFDVETMSSCVPEGCGMPKVLFCTHLDTVPPFIPPTVEYLTDGTTVNAVKGRGTCDAKGQIFAMWEACKALEAKGYDGFGLLLLAGEETGSFGAKAYCEMETDAQWVIVGEPTDNCMAAAAKGTKSFEVTFRGKAFHSGYPEYGRSAIEMFNDFMNALRSIRFPYDDLLGETIFNIGKLTSENPQNILSPELTCRIYFRTTFESDEMHHCHKLDAPSGTARSLADIVDANMNTDTDIQSVRCGEIPGIHTIGFEGLSDRIKMTHEAFSREGFAAGAVEAALVDRQVAGGVDFLVPLGTTGETPCHYIYFMNSAS